MILSNPFRFKIYLYPKIIDMRKSWNGLVSLVQVGMNLDPFEKSLFVFCGRSQRLIKIIYWDGNGFCPPFRLTDETLQTCALHADASQSSSLERGSKENLKSITFEIKQVRVIG